jgi:hypothetical protein
MTTLAKDKPRSFEAGSVHPAYNEVPIIASDTVYAGAAVGESASTGTGRPLLGTGTDNFMGFCIEMCANESGSAAAKLIKVLSDGTAWLSVTGADNIDDYGDTVYATDDDTFTMTSTNAVAIGKLVRYDAASGMALVRFQAAAVRSI